MGEAHGGPIPPAGPESAAVPAGTSADPAAQNERTLAALARVLAHELQTPLTTIYGGAQLVADPALSEAARVEAAHVVGREAQRLYDVVQDLVVLVRPESGTGDAEPILVQHLVAEVVGVEHLVDETVAIETSVSATLPPVLANAELLAHVLRNLVGAAIRHAPPGTSVTVGAVATEAEVTIEIRDAGPGLTAAEAAAAFDLFATSPRTFDDPSGANLRAHVAARIVAAMGGSIRAAPQDSGLEVSLSLPRGDLANGSA